MSENKEDDLTLTIDWPEIASVDALFGPVVESYGSVEGRLEGIMVHGVRQIYVYESLTGRQVRCAFGMRISLEEIFKAFEQRVRATGVIKSRAKTGHKISVTVQEFRVFKPDTDLAPVEDILKTWREA